MKKILKANNWNSSRSCSVYFWILATPMLLLTSAWDKIKNFFGWETEEEMTSSPEYSTIYKMKTDYGYNLEIGELTLMENYLCHLKMQL